MTDALRLAGATKADGSYVFPDSTGVRMACPCVLQRNKVGQNAYWIWGILEDGPLTRTAIARQFYEDRDPRPVRKYAGAYSIVQTVINRNPGGRLRLSDGLISLGPWVLHKDCKGLGWTAATEGLTWVLAFMHAFNAAVGFEDDAVNIYVEQADGEVVCYFVDRPSDNPALIPILLAAGVRAVEAHEGWQLMEAPDASN